MEKKSVFKCPEFRKNWLKRLNEGDTIITAYCQPAAGPGWANAPVCLIVQNNDGKLRKETIQPDEQSLPIHQIYGICAMAHSMLMKEVSP